MFFIDIDSIYLYEMSVVLYCLGILSCTNSTPISCKKVPSYSLTYSWHRNGCELRLKVGVDVSVGIISVFIESSLCRLGAFACGKFSRNFLELCGLTSCCLSGVCSYRVLAKERSRLFST